MVFIRKWVVIALIGALFGDIIAMLIAPAIIGWYNSTVDPSAMCNCLSTARMGAAHVIQGQLIGSSAGTLLFLVFGAFISRHRRQKLKAQPPAAPAASSQSAGTGH